MITYSLDQFEKDERKTKSRERPAEMIIRVFPSVEDRANLNGVFLTGPSLVEYEQVFKKVGLLPKNVFGVERDDEAFARVYAQNQALPEKERINLFHGDIGDFLRTQNGFDIVSLDFDLNYGSVPLRIISDLFNCSNPALNNEAVVYLNLQARRESQLYQTRISQIHNQVMPAASKLLLESISVFTQEELNGQETRMSLENLTCLRKHASSLASMVLIDSINKSVVREANAKDIDFSLRENIFLEIIGAAIQPFYRSLGHEHIHAYIESLNVPGEEKRLMRASYEETCKHFETLSWSSSLNDPLVCSMLSLSNLPLAEIARHAFNLDQEHNKFPKWMNLSQLPNILNVFSAYNLVGLERVGYTSSTSCPMTGELLHLRKSGKPLLDYFDNLSSEGLDAFFKYSSFIRRLSHSSEAKYASARRQVMRNKGLVQAPLELLQSLQGFRVQAELKSILLRPGLDESLEGILGGYHLKSLQETLDSHHLISEIGSVVYGKSVKEIQKLSDVFEKLQTETGAGVFGRVATPEFVEKAKKLRMFKPEMIIPQTVSSSQVEPIMLPERTQELPVLELKEEPDLEKNSVASSKQNVLSDDDKETIRTLRRQGYSVDDIYSLFDSTKISKPQVGAVAAWVKIKQKDEALLDISKD